MDWQPVRAELALLGDGRSCTYGKGVDTQTLLGRGKVPEFLWVFEVFGRFPSVSGRVSYPPGPILGSAFLWRCFCRQKPPCMLSLFLMRTLTCSLKSMRKGARDCIGKMTRELPYESRPPHRLPQKAPSMRTGQFKRGLLEECMRLASCQRPC